MGIMDKLQKNSKIKQTAVLDKSKLFTEKSMVTTPVPMINVALSGDPDGGLSSGMTVLAGPSKHFKTSFGLLMAAAYLDKHEDAVLLFYDSEFGSPQNYFKSFGIDTKRVLHTPITNVEELKFDLISQLENMEREDKVIIMIDSIGNIASKKELDDTMNEKSVADMSRAKALKSLFRMSTPYLTLKDIPLLAVNHTYQEIGMFPKAVVSGGTGIYYTADNIWIIGRQQDKKGTDIVGYNFVINVEKSRFVKEKSKLPISVTWEGGIESHSGLLDVALEGGFVNKPTIGWYSRVDTDTGEIEDKKVRIAETLKEEFWKPIFENTNFKKYLKAKFQIGHIDMIQ
ncbi:MAG: recombinase RecA [Gammaproteobacteria bacterium]|nr:recombinase RecA [Gammaproteobacteria bacterium]|tara:strand:+ start:28995 stop:30020 length:1026 start_codon:yes stop_codon:yes gene_type:complete